MPQRLNLRLSDLNKTLVTLSLPSIIENCLYSLVFVTDTLIVGWLHKEEYLAGAALAGMVVFLMIAPFIALSISATSIVARSWGEHAFDSARQHAGCAMTLAMVMAAALVGLGMLFAESILRLCGAAPEVVQTGAQFLWILSLSGLTGLPMMVGNGILRGMGDTFRPMIITGLMNVINIVTSVMLAFGIGLPKLGFYGVAWGTTIARTTGLCLCLILLTRSKGLGLRLGHFGLLQKNVLARIWYLALPALAERGLNSLCYMFFMRMVAHLGTTVLAAHQIAIQIENVAIMPAFGLATAITTVTGQAIGANLQHIAKIAVKRIILAATSVTVVVAIVFICLGPQIAALFGATDQVIHLASMAVRLSVLELPFVAIAFIFMGALRGAGDTTSPLYVGLVSLLIFRLGGVYLLAYALHLGLAGVWLATALDWLVRAIGLGWFFKREAWTLLHEKEKRRFG
jgi:putative MATE family efflux protein